MNKSIRHFLFCVFLAANSWAVSQAWCTKTGPTREEFSQRHPKQVRSGLRDCPGKQLSVQASNGVVTLRRLRGQRTRSAQAASPAGSSGPGALKEESSTIVQIGQSSNVFYVSLFPASSRGPMS